MKKIDFNKKYLGVPLAVIILLIGIGVAAATSLAIVYETTIQGSVTVEETTSDNSYEVTVYETDSCEHEITAVDFGSAKPGNEATTTFYIKNTGDSYIPRVDVRIPEVDENGWSEMGGAAYSSATLEPGKAKQFNISLPIGVGAQPGDYSGEIKIVCKASE